MTTTDHTDLATTHRAALVDAGLTCGPVTVVDGEPGFDVDGYRTTIEGRALRVGHLWAPMSGRSFEVTHVAKGRGAYAGWLRVQYRNPDVGGDGITQQHVRPSEKLTVDIRPHRRSFGDRGSMLITRR